MDSTYLPLISTLKRMSFEPRSHPCSTRSKLKSYLKKHKKSSPQKPPKRTNAYQNCIQSQQAMHLLCNKKSFTDSSLIVLGIQGIATNCKGTAMEVFSQTMNVKRNVNTFSGLTWSSMRKETCTYNELGEFLRSWVLESAQDTAHWKIQRKKPLPTISIPRYNNAVQNYRINPGYYRKSTTAQIRTPAWLQIDLRLIHLFRRSIEIPQAWTRGFLPYEV